MKKRKTWSTHDKNLYTLAAAYLRSRGDTQKQIADKLEINQSEVSRMLQQAELKRWLKPANPVFDPGKDEGLWEQARTRWSRYLSSSQLLTKLQALEPPGRKRLRLVTPVPITSTGDFQPAVTAAIQQVFLRASLVGVTWGRTIRNLVDLLVQTIATPIRANDPVGFVPLCGEPLKDRIDPLAYSSSNLVAELNRLVNGPKTPPPPSLAGVPAFIPEGYTPAQVKVIRSFIGQVAGYGDVFGEGNDGKEPLVDRVDTILTSLGVVESDYRGIFLKERVELRDITEKDLIEMALGDIGGVIIPRKNLGKHRDKQIEDMDQRWTGLQRHHLERCAAAAGDSRPGVVVLARGATCPGQRAAVVCRCIEFGVINELIIDQHLAEALDRG